LSAQTLTSYVLITWKLRLVGTTRLEAFPCLLTTQFLYSPSYPLNQPKGLDNKEFYYQIITTNNQSKALVNRVGYNTIISTNNHMNGRSGTTEWGCSKEEVYLLDRVVEGVDPVKYSRVQNTNKYWC